MKNLVLYAVLAVAALAVTVPVVANGIRALEPGRDQGPELRKLADMNIEVPREGPYVLAHCADPCRLGSWVKLYVGRTVKEGYLAVWADAGDDRIWYFPSESSFSPAVQPTADVRVLSEALKLKDGHRAHRTWKLELVLTDKRYTRDEVSKLAPEHVVARDTLTLSLGEGQ